MEQNPTFMQLPRQGTFISFVDDRPQQIDACQLLFNSCGSFWYQRAKSLIRHSSSPEPSFNQSRLLWRRYLRTWKPANRSQKGEFSQSSPSRHVLLLKMTAW